MRITAKYAGACRGCGGSIEPGTEIEWSRRGGSFHTGCRPSGQGGRPSRGDHQYWQGRRDVDNWHENIRMFGQEAADRMEFERELREGDGY